MLVPYLLSTIGAVLVAASPTPTASTVPQSLNRAGTSSPNGLSKSNGFQLMAYTTHSGDLATEIQGLSLTGYHSGAGQNIAVLLKTEPSETRIFYLNGTEPDTALLADYDNGNFPYGLRVPPAGTEDSTEYTVELNVGEGTQATISTENTDQSDEIAHAVNVAGPGSFLACKRRVYTGKLQVVVAYVYSNGNATVPTDCVPIRLVPKCEKLPDAGTLGLANHDVVQTVPCYKNMS